MDEILVKRKNNIVLIFFTMILFKFAIDIGFWKLVSIEQNIYHFEFNIIKYVVGWCWNIILFLFIKHNKKRVSTFLIYLVYLVQILPLTTIYALCNEDSIYFNSICFGFLLCEIIVGSYKNDSYMERNGQISRIMEIVFFAIVIITIIAVVYRNGMPTLTALNIYDVYELRRTNPINLSNGVSYFFEWMTKVILPFYIAKTIVDKKYIITLVCGFILTVMYLYSGYKSIIFGLLVVVVVSFWSQRNKFYYEIYTIGSIIIFLVIILALFSPILEGLFKEIFSLFGRRMMLLSANNKFVYYDYFSNNPHMGLGGILPRWLLYVHNYYENIPYTFEISDIYFNLPEMNSNTGFFAEGFMRFGHLGTILIFIVFALILRQIDKFEKRNGYSVTVGIFVYPVFMLTDSHLIDAFVLGDWMILVCILLFYKRKGRNSEEKNKKLNCKI